MSSPGEGGVVDVPRAGPPGPGPPRLGAEPGTKARGGAGRAGAVPGRARSPGPTAETREAFRPGVRRPQRPHHGFGSRELRAQRRPESGLPRLPGLLSKLPSPAPLCDIGWRPPSLDSASAEPGSLSAPASCALGPYCGLAAVAAQRLARAVGGLSGGPWAPAIPAGERAQGGLAGCPRLPAARPSPSRTAL